MQSIFPYLVRMRENTDQSNSRIEIENWSVINKNFDSKFKNTFFQ